MSTCPSTNRSLTTYSCEYTAAKTTLCQRYVISLGSYAVVAESAREVSTILFNEPEDTAQPVLVVILHTLVGKDCLDISLGTLQSVRVSLALSCLYLG